MLAGRTRRKKMRDSRRHRDAAGEDTFDENPPRNGAPSSSGVRFSLPPPEAPEPTTNGADNDPSLRRRSSHLTDTSTRAKSLENDAALKDEVSRLESTDSKWRHPMGFNVLSALRVLNAPADPVLSNTGYWIQPEDPEDIPGMFDSYLNVNCLYYSLCGVLAIETSLWLPLVPLDAPNYAHYLIAVSRFCWAANGVWSMAAVVASFHILWSIYATPTWAKRRFVFDNSRTISVVYAMGAPNFALMMIGTITGTMGNIFSQGEFTKLDWIPAVAGLCVGVVVAVLFVLCSGSLICKAVRPWKIADENLSEKKERWSMMGRTVSMFFRNYEDKDCGKDKSSKEDPDGDLEIYDVDEAGFGDMRMPYVAQKLCGAGFTLRLLQRVDNEVLLDQLIQGAGVDKAGDRLRVILFVRDAPKVVRMSSIVSGDMDQREVDMKGTVDTSDSELFDD